MKRIPWTSVLLAAAAMAQTPPPSIVKCKGPDGMACTSKQVQALSDAVFAEKTRHDQLVPVKSLTLASSDGTLKCEQDNGTACTTPELDAIKEIAAGQQLYINYNSSKPNTKK